MSKKRFNGKTVIITGGGSGIGLATAARVAASRRYEDRLPYEGQHRIIGDRGIAPSLPPVDFLNAKRVPTPTGGMLWQKSHVVRLLHTQWVQEITEDLDGRA